MSSTISYIQKINCSSKLYPSFSPQVFFWVGQDEGKIFKSFPSLIRELESLTELDSFSAFWAG